MTKKHKRRRVCALVTALALIGALLLPTAAAAEPRAVIDGANFPGGIEVRQGTTYIPMRGFFEFLGGWSVTWDSAKGRATAQSTNASVTANPASQTMQVNGSTVSLPFFARDGHIYLPLRALCILLDYEVVWDSTNTAARISTTRSAVSWSENELYWMSRIISAESRGEPLSGQIAVGNVVLNRVASSQFPNTIYDVIFDRKDAVQFEPVSNGTVYNTPTDASVLAAKLALGGVNMVGNCMFFYNPSLSQGTWIVNNRTYSTTIGCHRFYL